MIELPSLAAATSHSWRHLAAAGPPAAPGGILPIHEQEVELDVGVGLYQAIELAAIPGEAALNNLSATEENASIDWHNITAAILALLSTDSIAGVYTALAGD